MLNLDNLMIVIGHLTDTTVNIFVGYKNYISYEKPIYAKCHNSNINLQQELKPYHNYTTIFRIENLESNTKYSFNISINIDDSSINITKEIIITTLNDNNYDGTINIALCSCHYPNPLKTSDKIFKSFTNVLSNYNNPIVFHVGDQVYADQLNRYVPIRRVDQHKEFIKLYEDKYSGKHFSNFSSKFPSIMTLDDHEIEDNWNLDRIGEKRDLFLSAINAYKIYQMSHSPLFNGNLIDFNNSRLYYNLNIGIYPFFILDVRTERSNKSDRLFSDYQFNDLCKWLLECPSDIPKFIVSSVILAPFDKGVEDDKVFRKTGIYKGSDNWNGYSTKNKLLEFIINNNIQKVVFLSGDIHNSLAVTIKLKNKNNNKIINIHQIISSPLFWPFPFANGDINSYILKSTDLCYFTTKCFGKKKDIKLYIKDNNGNKWCYNYISHENTHTQLNNFAILEINKENINVKWFGIDEKEITNYHLQF